MVEVTGNGRKNGKQSAATWEVGKVPAGKYSCTINFGHRVGEAELGTGYEGSTGNGK